MPFLAPVFGAIGGILAGAGSFLASGTFLATAAKFALNIGLNLAISLLTKPDKAPGGSELDIQYGGKRPRVVRFGRWGIQGHYVFANTSGGNNEFLSQIFAVSDYYTTSLDRVWIGTQEVTLTDNGSDYGHEVTSGDYAGLAWVKFYDGRQTLADSKLVSSANPSTRWTDEHIGIGVSYIIVTMKYDQEKLNSALSFTFEGKGAPLYDWRKDTSVGGSGSHRWSDVSTHEFSENPIVQEYNYRRGLSVNDDMFCGMGFSASKLPLDKWSLAANVCDEPVSGGPRFRCATGIDCTLAHGDNISAMMRSCNGLSIRGIGVAFPVVGTDRPVVASLTEFDFVSTTPVSFQARRADDELINTVAGSHPEPDNLWSPTPYETATSNDLIVLDRRTKDVAADFGMVPYPHQAAQLAAQALAENRLEAQLSCVVRPRWQVLEPGDCIAINHPRYGNRQWIVESMEIEAITSDQPGNVRLQLQEWSGDIFAPITGVGETVITPPPGEVVRQQELAGFIVIGSQIIGADGRVVAALRASWTAPSDPTVSGAVLEYRVKAQGGLPAGDIIQRAVDRQASIALISEGIVSNTVYEVRHRLLTDPARTVSPSEWIEVSAPDTPSNDVVVGLGQIADDMQNVLSGIYGQLDQVFGGLDLLSQSVSRNTATEMLERTRFYKEQGRLSATLVEEQVLRVSGDAALAQETTALQAALDDAEGDIATQATALQSLTTQVNAAPIVISQAAEPATTFPLGSLWKKTSAPVKDYVLEDVGGTPTWVEYSVAGMTVFYGGQADFANADPVTDVIGALWYDTDNGNEANRWNGTAWVSVRDTALAQQITAVEAQANEATADGLFKIEAFAGDDTTFSEIALVARVATTGTATATGYANASMIMRTQITGGVSESTIDFVASKTRFSSDDGTQVKTVMEVDGTNGQVTLDVARAKSMIVDGTFTTADGKWEAGNFGNGLVGTRRRY